MSKKENNKNAIATITRGKPITLLVDSNNAKIPKDPIINSIGTTNSLPKNLNLNLIIFRLYQLSGHKKININAGKKCQACKSHIGNAYLSIFFVNGNIKNANS